MGLKNLTLLRLLEPFPFTAETLAARLGGYAFQPCPSHQPSIAGWTPPLGRKATELVHVVNGRLLLCLRTEEKLLPAMVINQAVDERIAVTEEQQLSLIHI